MYQFLLCILRSEMNPIWNLIYFIAYPSVLLFYNRKESIKYK